MGDEPTRERLVEQLCELEQMVRQAYADGILELEEVIVFQERVHRQLALLSLDKE